MQAQQELRSITFADISNRAENQSKRISFTSISTDITCTNFKSPSAIKPCFFRSPAPNLRLTQCENTFFPDSRAGKRPRQESSTSETKKSKTKIGPITKLITELYDPESDSTLGFRCFREAEIIGDQKIEDTIIKNECDDDCPTDDLQIEACTEFMVKAIEEALIKYVP
jgi:hypothetical protein